MTDWLPAPEPYDRLLLPAWATLDWPGVYILRRHGATLYVGMASALGSRLGDHRRAGMLSAVTSGDLCPTDTTQAAARLERALIWLLNPSENESRPSPTGPLWAATLDRHRPLEGWRWGRSCGHVLLGPHALADPAEVEAAGCSCKPWASWLSAARAHQEGLAAELAVARAALAHPPPCSACEAQVASLEALSAKVDALEDLRDRAEWAP